MYRAYDDIPLGELNESEAFDLYDPEIRRMEARKKNVSDEEDLKVLNFVINQLWHNWKKHDPTIDVPISY